MAASLAGCVGSTLVSLRAPAAYGDLFAAVLSGDTAAGGHALLAAFALYALSAGLSAGTRALGATLTYIWYARMVTAGSEAYLQPAAEAPASALAAGGWRRAAVAAPPPLLTLQRAAALRLDAWDQRLVGDTWVAAAALGPLAWGGGATLPLAQVAATMVSAAAAVGAAYGALPLLAVAAYTVAALAAVRLLLVGTVAPAAALAAGEGLLRAVLRRVAARPEEAVLAGALRAEAARAATALAAVVAASLRLTTARSRRRRTAS